MTTLAKTQAFSTSHRTLKLLALFVWLTGPLVLILKSRELLLEAHLLKPASVWIWISITLGITFGTLKARYLFRKACQRNLFRIDTLKEPKLWQFFRPGFFLGLALMIATGSILSRMAHGDFSFLLFVAALDLSIATALLGSCPVFWQENSFRKI
jgi:hypothetical protein